MSKTPLTAEQIQFYRDKEPKPDWWLPALCDTALELERRVAEKDKEIAVLQEELEQIRAANGQLGVGA
mgnify:CR=1 FL=1